MGISLSLLKSLLLIPSKDIVDFVLVKVKNWDPEKLRCHCIDSAPWTEEENAKMDVALLFLNILLNSSDDIKKKHCSKQIRIMLEWMFDFAYSVKDERDQMNVLLKILECIELHGKEYLDEEYMMKLKVYLLRLNEEYLQFKEAKQWEIIVVTRRILKNFFGIDGEKIIDKKYDEKDDEYIATVLFEAGGSSEFRGPSKGYRGYIPRSDRNQFNFQTY